MLERPLPGAPLAIAVLPCEVSVVQVVTPSRDEQITAQMRSQYSATVAGERWAC